MAGYQVYIPGARGASPQLLLDVGLGELCDAAGCPEFIDVDGGGPDEGHGACAYWTDWERPDMAPRPPGVHLDRQTWQPARPRPDGSGAGRFWLGCENARPVTPPDVQRSRSFDGEAIELADGQRWRIPKARLLPHTMELDERGQLAAQPEPRFAEYCRQSALALGQIMAWSAAGQADQLPEGWTNLAAFDFCCLALSINYRVNRDLIAWLRLLTTSNMPWVIAASFELTERAVLAAQKKTAANGQMLAT